MERVIVGGPKYLDPERLWYEHEPGSLRAQALFETVRAIEHRQTSISDGHVRHADIYAGYTPQGLSWSGPTGTARPPIQATRNIIRSVCDTATALISKTWPRPRIVTDGGDWDVQQRASQLDKFLVGVYRRAKVYAVAQECFRDSTIFGSGHWVIRPCGKGKDFHLKNERILPTDLIVDEAACDESHVTDNYYIRRVLPLARAIKLYAKSDKDKARKLKDAVGRQPMTWPGNRYIPKTHVVLIEAFHTAFDGEDGLHTVSCEGEELLEEPWEHDWAPIITIYWSQPVSGFYGDGVAYRQYGRQKRINYLYRWVQRCQDLIAVPRVWVDAVNGPLKIQVSNEIGEIVGYRGQKPEFQSPTAVGAEIYNWLDKLEAGGFDDEGISQFTATNQIPKGIESAPAQREYSFKEGTRFAPVSQRWEDAVARDNAEKSLALYKDHAGTSSDSAHVSWSNRDLYEEIDWDDVDLETEQYEIRVEASSLEDLSPAGRIQAVIELSQTGWIEPAEGRRLLGHPDLERSDEKGTAAQQHAEWISCNLKKGQYIPPNGYGDLELQNETVRADLLLAEMTGAPKTADGRRAMSLMRQFLAECDSKMSPPPEEKQLGMNGMPLENPSMDSMMMGMPPGINAAPAPAMSLASAQGLNPMAGSGISRQNM